MEEIISLRRSNEPPTPQERINLQSLIEADEQYLAALQGKENQFLLGVENAQIEVTLRKNALNRVEKKSGLSQRLVQAFQTALQSLDDVELEIEELPVADDSSVISNAQYQDVDTLIQAQTDAVATLRKHLEETQIFHRIALDEVSVAQDDLKGALSLERFSRDAHGACVKHIAEVEAFINAKQNRFRPIWRVADEVWALIFQDVIRRPFDPKLEVVWDDQLPGSRISQRRQQVYLLGICHRWRCISESTPLLWRNPILVIGVDGALSGPLFDYYLNYSNGELSRLTITTIHPRFTSCKSVPLFMQLTRIKSVNTLHFDVTNMESTGLEELWSYLPSPTALSIADFSQQDGGIISIPSRFCSSITRFTVRNRGIMLPDEAPILEELSITRPFVPLPWLRPTINRACSLRSLEFSGSANQTRDPESSPIVLPVLESITCSLLSLSLQLGSAFHMPSLRRLCILPGRRPTLNDWTQFLAIGNRVDSIEELSIISRNIDRALKLMPHINCLQRLTVLEVRGDAVDAILQARIRSMATQEVGSSGPTLSCLLHLELLVIDWYDGTGEVLLQFIEATKAARLAQERSAEEMELSDTSSLDLGSRQLFDLHLLHCPHIEPEIRIIIYASLMY